MSRPTRIPTIDDLRVKLCYICREEEQYDAPPENPPRAWTHPCKCTLIAHEQCLLKWIQTAQANESRAPNALKCPQCGAQYELESENSVMWRVMQLGDKLLSKAGRLTVVGGVGMVIGLIGTSVYVVCTGYGAWAAKQFLGKEFFDLVLGDDPSYWPWTAFLNLPMIPFSLILSHFKGSLGIPPFLPILLAMPNTLSIRRVIEHWNLPENSRRLLSGTTSAPQPRSWPPTPLLFGLFGVPMLQMLYRRMYWQVYLKVMGTLPPHSTARPRRRQNRNGGENNGRRVNGAVMNLAEGPFGLRLEAEIRNEVIVNGQPVPNDDDAEDDLVIEVASGSIGRKVGTALLTPAIANWMGAFLLRVSRRSSLLRDFLGVRMSAGGVWIPQPSEFFEPQNLQGLGLYKQFTTGAQMLVRGMWGSARTFSDSDPVWWRNTVGLGLFIVVKDCLKLFHLWLAKRELASRKVKNRDFRGVDIRELDLIPSFMSTATR